MEREIVARPPRARCYRCGSPEIFSVCADCGCAMCADHTPSPLRRRWYEEAAGVLAYLSGSEAESGVVVCSGCRRPLYRFYLLGWAGLVVAAAGLAYLWWVWNRLMTPGIAGWLVLLLGVALLAAGALLDHLQQQRKASIARFPLTGRDPLLAQREYIGGRARLDHKGQYTESIDTAHGLISFSLTLGEGDRARYNRFRRQHRLLPVGAVASAGFVVLQGAAALRPEAATIPTCAQPNVLRLSRPLERGGLFVSVDKTPTPWELRLEYSFPWKSSLPLQIIPSLVYEGKHWALALDVQAARAIESQNGAPRITKLLLCAPPALGELEVWRPAGFIDSPAEKCPGAGQKTVLWKDLLMAPDDTEFLDGYHADFYLRFANQELLPNATLSGQIHARLPGRLLSGVEGVRLFHPTGHGREVEATGFFTDVHIGFTLALGSLDFRRPEYHEATLSYAIAPDDEFISALVERLSDEGVYVRRVVETGLESGRRRNRSWNLSGRHYQGLHPVDVELSVHGGGRPESTRPGQTTFELRTGGRYAVREEKRLASRLHDNLTALIADLAGKRARAGE